MCKIIVQAEGLRRGKGFEVWARVLSAVPSCQSSVRANEADHCSRRCVSELLRPAIGHDINFNEMLFEVAVLRAETT